MDEVKLTFPIYFPSGCPPEDATIDEVKVYRLCRNEHNITEDDFKSYYICDPVKYENCINAYGLSVLIDIPSVKAILNKNAFMKRKYDGCSCGITYKYTGKIKNTPAESVEGHYTWWICENVYPDKYFKICSIEGVEIK